MITAKTGDITKEACDAIVNPANSSGSMNGGVALAIKNAGGSEIEKEASSKAPIPVGSAVATKAGKLKCRFVIHAPTMEKPVEKIKAENVKKAVRAALELASKLNVRKIAFPGMGTGVGCVGFDEAANAMIFEMKKFGGMEIIIVDINEDFVNEFKTNLIDVVQK